MTAPSPLSRQKLLKAGGISTVSRALSTGGRCRSLDLRSRNCWLAGAYLGPTPTEHPGLSPALTTAASVATSDWTSSMGGGKRCNVWSTSGGYCPDFGVLEQMHAGRGMPIFLDRDIENHFIRKDSSNFSLVT
ncbi:hypothetical protein BDP55DRAFT_398709 [Colletotrichum godetiae]|uniref:Uncharacterized protein n=1 Tax=Colletotrichum godetiae TaxID=1209918 RepID=A0AAJ0ENB6_9PEZI|nr:uncharacterized protein BDP55DRAFT_398709 [Colletotrichum godetiae]KAK1658411.1 hypothetical protein BDP55DRAFT_398709 [Colletotrichum godetiae]